MLTFALLIISNESFAVEPPPVPDATAIGSVQPGRISGQVMNQGPTQPTGIAPPLKHEEEKAQNPLGAAASKIKFKLMNVILEDNTVYSDEQLLPIYKDKLNTVITIVQLQEIVQSITNFYRNNGYILSRAILPPQHVKNGVVKIRILEGSLAQVKVIGHPHGAKYIVQDYGQHIVESKPLKLDVMEKYLRIANEVPGTQVKAVLEPAKTQSVASDLNLATENTIFNGFLSYDNYGTRYIGPQQFTLGGTLNSIFLSGDTTRATYVTTARPKELKFSDLFYEMPLGTEGLRMSLDGNFSATNPLYFLQGLIVSGTATSYTLNFSYPYIRSHSASLSFQGGGNYLDSYVSQLNQELYSDHTRSVNAGINYDFADRYQGANSLMGRFEQGLPILGATSNNHSHFTSRYGATGLYSKVYFQMTRLQGLFWKFTGVATLKGQYSFNPLLSSAQFGFGGPQLGRGYDPAEIIGDRGIAGSLELRLDLNPELYLMQAIQLYVFYDLGETWNLRNVQPGTDTILNAISAGGGARITLIKNLSGNFMIAQPLTRQVQSLQLIGNGKRSRVLFSITASV